MILSELGYEPWLDEDAMAAGASRDREIKKGMQESCAAIFFVTPQFADNRFLKQEIDYAVHESMNWKHCEKSFDPSHFDCRSLSGLIWNRL
jgi:hypothetical protein